MKEQTFTRLLLAVIGICVALTVAHLVYVIIAYQHCSIIQFIAKELW